MREIKFRAKLASGEIIYSDDFLSVSVFFDRVSAEGLEVEQFICRHDKNGKEIYEGDIVITADLSEGPLDKNHWSKSQVVFSDVYCGFSPFCLPNCYGHTAEIIGNIHEKEQLK